MQQSIDIEKFMTSIRMKMLRMHPFYGHVLMQMPIVYTNEINTFGVGKMKKEDILIKLFINAKYIEHVSQSCENTNQLYEHFYEVLKHEVHHLLFGHVILEMPDKFRQKIACELSANSYVNRNSLIPEEPGQQPGVFPEDYELESKQSVYDYYKLLENNEQFLNQRKLGVELLNSLAKIADDQLKNADETMNTGCTSETKKNQDNINNETSSAKEKMDSLPKNAQESIDEAMKNQADASKKLSKNDSNGASESMKKAAENLKKSIAQSIFQQIDSHDKWSNVEGDKLAEGMIKNIIRNAGDACKQNNNWGDLPGEIVEAIKVNSEIQKPVIPWEIVLKDFLASSSENILDYTMKKRSKRYGTRPGTKKEDVLQVAIGIDTSGSIDDDMLNLFFNELTWMEKTGTKITVFEWDTQVNREYPFSEFDGTVSGRGGTDPTDFLEKVSERKFDCIIIFTDLYFSPIAKRYGIPMMWVIDSGYDDEQCFNTVQEGIVMKINEEKNGFNVIRR